MPVCETQMTALLVMLPLQGLDMLEYHTMSLVLSSACKQWQLLPSTSVPTDVTIATYRMNINFSHKSSSALCRPLKSASNT